MGVITFNGVSSQSYHIQVETPPGYDSPERDYQIEHVVGKNGDIVIDNGSYKNTTRSYDISIYDNKSFTELSKDITTWLFSSVGYARLEDSYEPDYYRLARYSGTMSLQNILGQAGKATIKFDCKPQRFLKTGDQKVIFSSAGTITNQTFCDSLPIITVKGSGSGVVTIGNYSIIISSIPEDDLTINSEIQDAYSGLVNKNSTITLSNGFPKLIPGNNNVSFSGGVTSVEVVPKWWTL